MFYRHYVADGTIPGLSEVEVERLVDRRDRTHRGVSRRLLRDLGLDRDAS